MKRKQDKILVVKLSLFSFLLKKLKSIYFFNLSFLQISLPQHPNPPSSGLGQAIQFGGAGLQQVVMNVGGQQVIVQQPQQQQQQQAQVLSVRTANGQVVQVKIEFLYLKLNLKNKFGGDIPLQINQKVLVKL